MFALVNALETLSEEDSLLPLDHRMGLVNYWWIHVNWGGHSKKGPWRCEHEWYWRQGQRWWGTQAQQSPRPQSPTFSLSPSATSWASSSSSGSHVVKWSLGDGYRWLVLAQEFLPVRNSKPGVHLSLHVHLLPRRPLSGPEQDRCGQVRFLMMMCKVMILRGQGFSIAPQGLVLLLP